MTFTPTASGTRNGSLTVTDSATNSPQTATLTGTGTGPAVTLSTNSLTFPAEIVKTTGSALSVTVKNTGTASLSFSSFTTTGDFAVSTGSTPCSTTTSLGATLSCYIYVTFTPTASGTRSGTLSIADNASGSPQSVTLSGTGMDFSVTASPTSRQIAATASTTFTLTVAPLSGFTGTVGVSCSSPNATVTCTFSPTSVILGSSKTSTATVKTGVGGHTPRGTYKLTMTGADGALSHSTTVSLKVK